MRTHERKAFTPDSLPEVLKGTAFMEEAGADTFRISNLPFTPASVLAHVLRADNVAVAVDGTVESGEAVVTLVADCYHVAGRLSVAIYITDSSENSVCVYACIGSVYRTLGATELDSGTTVPTLAQLEAAYAACVEATQDAETAALTAVTYAAQTGKTDAQKAQARTNIGAASEDDVSEVANAFEITEHKSDNLLDVTQIETGCYYWTNGKNTNSSYNATPLIPVEPGQKIWLQYGLDNAASRQQQGLRFVVGYDSDGVYISGSEASSVVSSYTVPSGVAYIRISSAANVLNAAQKPMILASDDGTVVDFEPYFAPYTTKTLKAECHDDEHIESLIDEAMSESRHVKNGVVLAFDISSDNHATAEDFQDMFDYSVQFRGAVGTFNGLIVAHGYNYAYGGYVKVTPTTFSYYLGTEANPRFTEAHGLTIKDYIAIRIDAKPGMKADFTVTTNGGSYTKADGVWDVRQGPVSVRSDGSNTLTGCVLSYNCAGWSKPIHMYGDSYFGTYDSKWTKHLLAAGYTDHNQNGYPGRQSATALAVAKVVLANSNPEKIVWCLGMNDGDDGGSVDTVWKACVEELDAICEARGIELILATIPNVATVDNTAKNAYVQASGHRYIDTAAAVGAANGTTWYDGMLSNDGVHPAEAGAIAIFNQAIADVPELMQ